MYYYILEEYKVSNELLTEDIYVRGPPSSLPDLRAMMVESYCIHKEGCGDNGEPDSA